MLSEACVELFSFFCCVVPGQQKIEDKKQSFAGQNNNLSGACGRLCSLLCCVATQIREQKAIFCQINLG
jgi:hypothetical protein